MRPLLAAAAIALLGQAAVAAEPGGCDTFSWNISAERRLLAEAVTAVVPSGFELTGGLPVSRTLALDPAGATRLPHSPERATRTNPSFAGFAIVAIPDEGVYRVTLSGEAWVDSVQAGTFRKVEAFSGVRGCPGARKSVKFRLERGPLILQLSDSPERSIAFAVTRDP